MSLFTLNEYTEQKNLEIKSIYSHIKMEMILIKIEIG